MRVEVMGKGPHGVSPVGVAETPGCRGRGVRSYLLYSGGSFSSIQLRCISGGWRTGRRTAEAGKAELVKSDQEAGEPRSSCSSPATKQNQFASKSLRETSGQGARDRKWDLIPPSPSWMSYNIHTNGHKSVLTGSLLLQFLLVSFKTAWTFPRAFEKLMVSQGSSTPSLRAHPEPRGSPPALASRRGNLGWSYQPQATAGGFSQSLRTPL